MRETSALVDSLAAVRASFAPVARSFTASRWRGRIGQPGVAAFAFGNPRAFQPPTDQPATRPAATITFLASSTAWRA